MHSRNLFDWFLAFFNVFVIWSFGSIASSYSSQVLGINPIVYVCIMFLSCSAFLLIFTGPGKNALNVLRNTQTWGYGLSLILSFIVSFGLFSQVTPAEGELLQMFTAIVSVVLGWLLFNRVPNKLQSVGLLFILAGVIWVCTYQSLDKLALIVFLVVLLSIFQCLRSFTAESHYHFNHVIKYSKNPIKDQLRVIGFIMFSVSISFLMVVIPLAALQSYTGQVIHPVIPTLDDFLYFKGIVVSVLVGILIILPARFLEFNSLNKLKTENYLALGALGPFATMFWQSVTQGYTGLDLTSFSSADIFAAVLISIGGLIIVISKVLFKAKEQDILNEYINYIDSDTTESYEIIIKSLDYFDNDKKAVAEVLKLPDVVINKILEDKLTLKEKYFKIVSKQYNKKIVTMDILTKMHNRVALEDEFRSLDANNKDYAIVYFDLNKFKEVNDRFGHDSGDYALKVISKRLLAIAKKNIDFYRLGGDEFAVVYKINNLAGLDQFIKLAEEEILHPFELEHFNVVVNLGVSFGIAKSTDHKKHKAEQLLKIADENMYKHKDR
jgi:diguanylate cyclase (GGDEF)-like protein